MIKNALVIPMKNDGEFFYGDILIKNGKIAEVGEKIDSPADETIDAEGAIVLPAFINAHTHLAMILMRNYKDDKENLQEWLSEIFPIEDKLEADDIFKASRAGIAELIKGGCTTFADMYFFMDDVARAVEASGIRAALSRGLTGVTPNAQQALQENKEFYKTWHGKADGRITVMFGPHAPYTCPPDYIRQVVEAAGELGAEVHTHLCETKGEVDSIVKQYGKSPIALMDELGLFDCGCLAAHCVWVDDADMDIMVKKGVRVAHNPGSNLKLASGIAPVQDMLKKGIVVGLGTDGASSNNNLDIMEEMHLAAFIHKAHTLDPLVVPAESAVNMMTEAGAACLGYTDIGKLETGYKADITLVDREGLHWYPKNDSMSLLAYSANSFDVDTVMVNGKVLLKGKEFTTLDIEKIKAEAERTKEKLFSAL